MNSCLSAFEKLPNAAACKSRRYFFNKLLALILLPFIALPLCGCHLMKQFRAPASQVAAPVMAPDANLEELISALNSRTAKVRQLKTSVRVATAGLPGLRGDLLVERPNRLRLQAGLMGMSDVGFDLGSNDQSFWIWQKVSAPGQPETFYHARHLDYQHSALRQQLQLQPTWLIDALGLVEFSPNDRHEGPFLRNDGRLEIRSWSHAPGTTAGRRTVVDPRTLDIHQQAFYDQQGRLVAWLNSTGHEAYPDYGINLPRQVSIQVTPPDGPPMELTVNAGQYSINAIYGDPDRIWEQPNPAGVRQIDLSQGTIDNPDIATSDRDASRPDDSWQYR